MAKLEMTIHGDFDAWLARIHGGILDGSATASLEDRSDFRSEDGTARCSVLVFERYSMAGGNRLSLTVTLFQGRDGAIACSAITAGGSNARFFKVNTWGEESFLDCFREIVQA